MLLNAGINLPSEGSKILFLCVKNSNYVATEFLINKGCKVDFVDKNDKSNTCLHEALKKTEPRMVELLLKNGAAINALNDFGFDALGEGFKSFTLTMFTNDSIENHSDEEYEAIYPGKVNILKFL